MTEWYDFPNVKFTKMFSFFSVIEAYGLIYPGPSGENSSFACLLAILTKKTNKKIQNIKAKILH